MGFVIGVIVGGAIGVVFMALFTSNTDKRDN